MSEVDKTEVEKVEVVDSSATDQKPMFVVRHNGMEDEEILDVIGDGEEGEELDSEIPDEGTEDPYLEEAKLQGYDPDFDGEFKRSPKEFVERGKILNTIHKQNQEIKALKENAKNQSDMLAKGMERAKNDALSSLKEERKLAREEGEWDKVDSIDEDIDSLKAEVETVSDDTAVGTPTTPVSDAQAQKYAADNPWMLTDAVAQKMAIASADAYTAAYPDDDGDTVLAYVNSVMKKNRPDLFKTDSKPTQMVTSARRSTRKPSTKASSDTDKLTYSKLSSTAKRQCDLFIRSTGMDVDKGRKQYCADLEMVGGE